jgi:hypothetical protein
MPRPEREPEFVRLQRAFARHLRDPARVPPPAGLEERRLAIYRYAVHANVERFLCDNYPRVCAALPAETWAALVEDYRVRHVARAHAFVDLPREFLEFLAHERAAAGDPPFLAELAHFDWLETLVGADERRLDLTGIDPDGDLLAGVPVANPIMQLVTYRFPVHRIAPDYLPPGPPPEPTRIAAFRAPDNLYGFLDLNGPAWRLLELIVAASGRDGDAIIRQVATELGRSDPAALLPAGRGILERMRRRGALLGTARR